MKPRTKSIINKISIAMIKKNLIKLNPISEQNFGVGLKKSTSLIFSIIILSSFFILLPNFIQAGGPTLDNPLKGKDLVDVILLILQGILGFVGLIALFMFILGGFEFLTSGGNQNMIKKGKDTLIWATIGLVVIILSYSILKFIFERIASFST